MTLILSEYIDGCKTCNGYGTVCCGNHNNDACPGECVLPCPDCDGDKWDGKSFCGQCGGMHYSED